MIITFFVLLNLSFLFFFDQIKIFHQILDKPDKIRKFHLLPTPLAGGVILIINIIFYSIIFLINNKIDLDYIIFKDLFKFKLFIVTCILIFLLGYIDDKYNLNPIIKLISLIIILSNLLLFDFSLNLSNIKLSFYDNTINTHQYAFFLTIFCLVVFINSFNMFDGINLQVSIYTLIIFITFLFYLKFSLLIKILIIFILLFKYLNYKNKSFLGDSGSLLLAFIIGYIFIRLYNENYILYTDEVFIYMMIPGIDMIRLFFERISLKRNPFSNDRRHLHHYLLKKFSYSQTIFYITLLVIIPILMNIFNVNKLLIILISLTFYFFLIKRLKII